MASPIVRTATRRSAPHEASSCFVVGESQKPRARWYGSMSSTSRSVSDSFAETSAKRSCTPESGRSAMSDVFGRSHIRHLNVQVK